MKIGRERLLNRMLPTFTDDFVVKMFEMFSVPGRAQDVDILQRLPSQRLQGILAIHNVHSKLGNQYVGLPAIGCCPDWLSQL